MTQGIYTSEIVLKALKAFAEEANAGRVTPEALAGVMTVLLKCILKIEREARSKNDLDQELKTFQFLCRTGPMVKNHLGDYAYLDAEWAACFRQIWIQHSQSPFANAYRLGVKNTTTEIMTSNAKRATNGRRLIGASSRAKVAKTAEGFRHLSKERAASLMAEIVNLDAGTIRRYLTELFPGDKWANKL